MAEGDNQGSVLICMTDWHVSDPLLHERIVMQFHIFQAVSCSILLFSLCYRAMDILLTSLGGWEGGTMWALQKIDLWRKCILLTCQSFIACQHWGWSYGKGSRIVSFSLSFFFFFFFHRRETSEFIWTLCVYVCVYVCMRVCARE